MGDARHAARRVALATAAEVGLDEDEQGLVPALASHGLEPAPMVWDDPASEWAAFQLVVVRSTWDYVDRREVFLDWARHVSEVTTILNAPEVLAWNTDKRYLRDLAGQGLPIVPTRYYAPGDPVARPDYEEVVVKPSVSAGSRDTLRHGPEQRSDALRHIEVLQSGGRTAMVQPYLSGVDLEGETALLYLDGSYSHAIRKGPLLPRGESLVEGLYAPEDIRPRTPTDEQRRLADKVLGALPFQAEQLLYARVDLLPVADGGWQVLEVELTEPSLFLTTAPGATERFAAAIAARLG